MANEVKISTQVTGKNGTVDYTGKSQAPTFTQTNVRSGLIPLDVGTTQESVSFGDITPGFLRLTNLDTTNFVEFGTVTGNLGFILPANLGTGVAYLKSGQTLYVKADTAACKILIEAFSI